MSPSTTRSQVVVAVDGPAGAGKSSVSRAVAQRLGLRYLDTGAMYRSVTWWMLGHGVDVGDAEAVALRAPDPRLRMGTDPGLPTVEVDDTDVSAAIRAPAVDAAVSAVSAVPAVRRRLVRLQRSVVEEARLRGSGMVVEGRDVATVVLPDADVKVFLTAEPQVRASRRARETDADLDATSSALRARDAMDSGRAASPLVRAPDAVEIDTSRLTLEQVVDTVEELVDAVVGVQR